MAGGVIDFLRSQAGGKALPSSRFFYDESPISTYIPGAGGSRERGLLTQRESAHHLQAYGGSEAIDWVSDCVGIYSDTTASAQWGLEKKGETVWTEEPGDEPTDQDAKQLVKLLREPNPFMDYTELMELLVIDLLLVGNAYWYKYQQTSNGRPLALYRLSPSEVKIKPGETGIEYYEYSPSGTDKKLKIAPEDLIHFKRPNPHSPYYGLGVIKSGGRPLDLELALTDSQANYFENKADPSLIVESERRVPRDVFGKLRAQLRARASGTHNAGELLLLEAGLKANSLSPNARDAMYADLSDKSRDRILAMFRVSAKLLGLTDAGSAADKVQDARREFDNKTMRPFLDKLQTKITRELAIAYGLSYTINYGYIMPQEDLVKLSGDFASIPGVKVKEVRRFLVEGGILRDESTGDEKIDDLVLNLPGEELGPDGKPINGGPGFADRNLPGEPGRPPLGKNTRTFPTDGNIPAGTSARQPRSGKALKSVNEVMAALDKLDPEVKAVVLQDPPGHTSIGNKLSTEERPDDVVADQREATVNAATLDIRKGLLDAGHVLERALLDHAEGKAFEPNTIVKRIRNSEAWRTFMSMISSAIESGATQAVSQAAVQLGNAGIVPDEDLDYEAIAASVVHRPEGPRNITKNLKNEIVQRSARSSRTAAPERM
jgi:HK97 family phage portal protein